MDDNSAHVDEPLTGQSGTVFNSKRGQRLDWPWTVLYLSCLAFAIVGGLATPRNADFNKATPEYLNNAAHCPARGLNLVLQHPSHTEPFDISDFVHHGGIWLLASAGGSLLVGLAFLQMFKHASTAATYATVAFQVCVPLAAGIGGMVMGAHGPAGVALLLAGLGAFTFYLWREQLALCAKLLALSASALTENPGLIGFVIITQIVSAILTLGMLVLTVLAYENGSIVRFPGVAVEEKGPHHMCNDADGQHVPCCMWQPSGWSKAYMTLSALTILWTVLLFGQMRTFVTAGTVAQWYFSPPGARHIKGTTRRMVAYALGPQFGTLCFAAAVLVVVQLIRSAAQEARNKSRDGNGNILMSLVACALECIASATEFLTKFALIFSAIVGAPLIGAGRMAVNLLRRNFLNTVGVGFLPPMIVQLASLSLSVVWGLGLYVAAHLSWTNRVQGNTEAVLLGVLSGGVALVVLSFCGGILLDIVDALYVCYATDRDQSEVTKEDVHDVFSQLPVGAVIEQPDGTRSYGSAADSDSRVTYIAPNEQRARQRDAANFV